MGSRRMGAQKGGGQRVRPRRVEAQTFVFVFFQRRKSHSFPSSLGSVRGFMVVFFLLFKFWDSYTFRALFGAGGEAGLKVRVLPDRAFQKKETAEEQRRRKWEEESGEKGEAGEEAVDDAEEEAEEGKEKEEKQ